MKLFSSMFVGSLLVCTLAGTALAQDKPAAASRPRILVIQREFIKPGKAGFAHEESESAFVQAMERAHWPTHYLGMTSMSGKSRALFFTQYDSFEAWEKDVAATEKNATLSAAIDRAAEADGNLQESFEQNVYAYNDEYSLHPVADISHMRYLDVWVAHVRPGKDKEWKELAKLFKTTYDKAAPEEHWAVFESAYGPQNGTFLYLTARKSAAELDRGPAEGKAIEAALGEDGMKKLNELFAAAVESSESQLFAFSPKMSYPMDEWVKADPEFWKPATKP